jgi:hypothetical protein
MCVIHDLVVVFGAYKVRMLAIIEYKIHKQGFKLKLLAKDNYIIPTMK